MHLLATVVLGTALIVLGTANPDEESDIYEQIFEDMDVDSILNNDRILDSYLKCFFNTGTCSNIASIIKERIPEVFSTVCGKCSDQQKGIFKHALEIFIPKRPNDWKHILEIYDPDGSYWPKIQEFLQNYKE